MIRPARKAQDRGFALLIVLWSLAGLSLLASLVIAGAGSELRELRLARGTAQMQNLAEGGIWTAVFHETGPFDRRWRMDNRTHKLKLDGFQINVRIRSEAGLINPNTASQGLLSALLQLNGVAHARADAIAGEIAQWRSHVSTDDRKEHASYLAAGLNYLPPHAPFESVTELALLPGMTPALVTALRPHLSVTQPEDPQYADADPLVQQALRNTGLVMPDASDPKTDRMTSFVVESDVFDGVGGHARRQATILLSGMDRPSSKILPNTVRILRETQ